MNNLPIVLCAVVGLILLLIEAFMPGFGLPGISGMLLLLAAIVLTWIEYGAYAGLGATLIVIAIGAITLTLSFKSAATGRLSRSALILKDKQESSEGYQASEDMSYLLGKAGTALTVLRPAGTADINGERVSVISAGDFIDKGAPLQVIEVEGARVLVKRLG